MVVAVLLVVVEQAGPTTPNSTDQISPGQELQAHTHNRR